MLLLLQLLLVLQLPTLQLLALLLLAPRQPLLDPLKEVCHVLLPWLQLPAAVLHYVLNVAGNVAAHDFQCLLDALPRWPIMIWHCHCCRTTHNLALGLKKSTSNSDIEVGERGLQDQQCRS